MPVSMTPYRVFPDYRHIDPAFFTRHGIRLLLCDLDYTLAPKSQPEPDDALRRWLSEVQAAGVTVMILSNNRSPMRVERFCRDLGITYEGHAGKPSPKGFRRAMARCGAAPEETAMLGDKLLTDMLGANRAGRRARGTMCCTPCKGRGRPPAGKNTRSVDFFPRKHLPNGLLSCRIYKADFRLVLFIQREWRYSLIHNGRNINMATITAGDFRNGKTFEMDGKVMQVVEFQHVKPGKGAAFVRTKMRNVVTGAVTETSFNPTAKFEEAFVDRRDMAYSYNDGDLYYFMDQETFDMVPLNKELLGDAFRFVTENTVCKVLSYKGSVFGLECPNFMGLAGNTATNTLKPATVETGAEVKVPLFINIGDKITIDTRTGEYLSRCK